jgi:DNA-binding PadR family transcriptional regulator
MSNASSSSGSEVAAMRSPLAWTLLGLVIERPSYGYELAQRFQCIYGDTLVLSNRLHIYRLLESLRDRALIEEVAPGAQKSAASGQANPHYCATAQGISAYKEWLVTQFVEERHRSWLFARQLGMLEPEAALVVIERHEAEVLREAEQATGKEEGEEEQQAGAQGASGVAKRLQAEDERITLGVRLSWIEYARRELKALVEERAKQ